MLSTVRHQARAIQLLSDFVCFHARKRAYTLITMVVLRLLVRLKWRQRAAVVVEDMPSCGKTPKKLHQEKQQKQPTGRRISIRRRSVSAVFQVYSEQVCCAVVVRVVALCLWCWMYGAPTSHFPCSTLFTALLEADHVPLITQRVPQARRHRPSCAGAEESETAPTPPCVRTALKALPSCRRKGPHRPQQSLFPHYYRRDERAPPILLPQV